jgi:acetyl-CoA acyltransferase
LLVDSIGLGCTAVAGLINKTGVDPKEVEQIVWGNVVLSSGTPNIGREIVIELNLPRHIVAHMISFACASSLKCVCDTDMIIKGGHADCVIAGGSDSVSHAEVPLPRGLTRGLAMTVFGGAKDFQSKLEKFWANSGPAAKWVPSFPAIGEKSTGKTMGYHCDMMAEFSGVTREAQDQLAAESHLKALEASKKGYLDQEITPIDNRAGKIIKQDGFIQKPDLAKYAKLKPAFRTLAQKGTITAANATGLTDGGSAVLMCSEEYAKKKGWPTDIQVKAWQNSAVDPFPQLLIAPAIAIPKCLDRAGLKLSDIDVWEIHEAFAAQVLSTFVALESEQFCRDYLGRGPVGTIDRSKLNINGGSLALGHPFAATGGRVVTSAANELRRNKKRYALLSVCAAGGLGSVAIIERVDELSAQPHLG